MLNTSELHTSEFTRMRIYIVGYVPCVTINTEFSKKKKKTKKIVIGSKIRGRLIKITIIINLSPSVNCYLLYSP